MSVAVNGLVGAAPPVSLTAWQSAAVEAWTQARGRGVVEAVTGSGKTVVGIEIAARDVTARRRLLVLVPGVALLQQWHRELRRSLPVGTRVGRLGNGYDDRPEHHQVTVAVINSAVARLDTLHAAGFGTVIADECHNYGATVWRQALLPEADHRLGLTATLERLDDGVQDVLEPYFGSTVFTCGFDKAFQDGLLAPARIALVGVDFTGKERIAYDEAIEIMGRTRRSLVSQYGVPRQPFGEFMLAVGALANDAIGRGRFVARKYLKARNTSGELIANARGKTRLMQELAPLLVAKSRGALIFSERISAADKINQTLVSQGVRSAAFHSGHSTSERAARLSLLGHGRLQALCTAKALDEGIDVPEVDLGLVAAGTQQKRQMIQRLGRVLRTKSDGRAARFVIVYVKGIPEEDPDFGAHVGFLEQIQMIHGKRRTFQHTELAKLAAWLNKPPKTNKKRTPAIPWQRRGETGELDNRATGGATQASQTPMPDPLVADDDEAGGGLRRARVLRGYDYVILRCAQLGRRCNLSHRELEELVLLAGLVAADADSHTDEQVWQRRASSVAQRMSPAQLAALITTSRRLAGTGRVRVRDLSFWLRLSREILRVGDDHGQANLAAYLAHRIESVGRDPTQAAGALQEVSVNGEPVFISGRDLSRRLRTDVLDGSGIDFAHPAAPGVEMFDSFADAVMLEDLHRGPSHHANGRPRTQTLNNERRVVVAPPGCIVVDNAGRCLAGTVELQAVIDLAAGAELLWTGITTDMDDPFTNDDDHRVLYVYETVPEAGEQPADSIGRSAPSAIE